MLSELERWGLVLFLKHEEGLTLDALRTFNGPCGECVRGYEWGKVWQRLSVLGLVEWGNPAYRSYIGLSQHKYKRRKHLTKAGHATALQCAKDHARVHQAVGVVVDALA